jgi:hypothetical protein
MSRLQEKPSALKRKHPALQKTLNFFTFYIFVPDPDPNSNGRSQMQGGKKTEMQTGSSETLIGWKSGKTTYVPLLDRMEGAWLWTQNYT